MIREIWEFKYPRMLLDYSLEDSEYSRVLTEIHESLYIHRNPESPKSKRRGGFRNAMNGARE